ncbi:hypothetical protein ACQ4WX_03850 [Streptomyces lasalocidi]
MRAILALDSDRVTEAREQVVELLAAMEEFADVEEVMATLVSLPRIQVRSGHCQEALHTAERCSRVMARTAPALYAAALAAAAGGTAEEARQLAEQSARAAEADGDQLFLLRSLAVLGQAGLLMPATRGAAFAVDALQRVRQLGAAMCAADPPLLHWYGDLAEALVFLGETVRRKRVRPSSARLAPMCPATPLAACWRLWIGPRGFGRRRSAGRRTGRRDCARRWTGA